MFKRLRFSDSRTFLSLRGRAHPGFRFGYELLCLLLFVAACVDPVDLQLPKSENDLAVVCHFSPLDTFELVLSRGHSVLDLDEDSIQYPSDASISIFGDGVLIDVLSYTESSPSGSPPHYRSSHFVPKEGESYTLRAVVEGEKVITAQSYVPFGVDIKTQTFSYDLSILPEDNFSNRAEYEISFEIPDPASEENFYHLTFYQEIHNLIITSDEDTLIQTFFSNPLRVETENAFLPLTPYIENRGYLFKDDFFSGTSQEFSFSGTFLFSKSNQQLGDFIVELRTVTKEYYQYHTALARYARSLSDPLASPVLVPGNVEQAEGIFTGFAVRFYAL